MVAGKQKRTVVFDAYCKNESGLEGMPGVVFNVAVGGELQGRLSLICLLIKKNLR